MFVFDLFEKKKQDPAAGRFVGGTSQDARVKNALDNAYRAVPAAKSPEEAALGYIDIQNSLNQKQDQVLSQQNKTNQQQTQQINALVADMRRKEKDFRDLNAQVASMPNVTPQQVAKMAQDIEAAHDAGKDEPVDVPSVIAKQTTAKPAAAQVAAPSPGASISQIANFQQAQDQGATAVAAKPAAAKPAPAPTKSAAGAQAFGAMASQLGGISGVENLPSQTYAAKATPGDTLKKNAVAQAAGTNVPVPTGSADDVNVLDPDVIASMTKDQEKSTMTEANREGDPNQGSINWTALVKSWSARLPSVDWKFGEKKSMRLYQPQMYALLQVIGNLHNAVEQEDIIQNVFSIRQRVDDLLNDTVTKQYMAHYAKWQQEQLEKQQQNQAQLSLLEPTGQPAEKGIEPEPKQGELFREDSWHAGDNSWSSEHDQWARESQGMEEDSGFDQEAGIGIDGKSFKFKIKDLVALADNYPVTKINPQQFSKQIAGRDEDSTQSMARAEKADLQYPIIVIKRQNGQLWIADGTHRAHKAILNKLPSINAKIIPIKDMAPFDVEKGVAEGSADKTVKVVKRNGKPIGEIGIDPEASPGNGSYYVKLYDGRVDLSGFDTAEEALAELKYLVKQGVEEGFTDTLKSVWREIKTYVVDFVANAVGLPDDQRREVFVKAGNTFSNEVIKLLANHPARDKLIPMVREIGGYMAKAKTLKELNSLIDKAELFLADVDAGKFDPPSRVAKTLPSFNDRRGMKENIDELKKKMSKLEALALAANRAGDDAKCKQYQEKIQSLKQKLSQSVAEVATDYSKRRARKRDIDAGRPVPKQRPSKMTDYQKRRAQDRKDMELGETTNYWTRLQQERFLREHKKAFDLIAELEQSIKDIK